MVEHLMRSISQVQQEPRGECNHQCSVFVDLFLALGIDEEAKSSMMIRWSVCVCDQLISTHLHAIQNANAREGAKKNPRKKAGNTYI